MKPIKIIVYVVTLLLLTTLAIANAPGIKVSLMSQLPDPAEPGNYADVRFKIENTGFQGTPPVTLELIPEYPFSLEPGDSAVRELGGFQSQQQGEKGIIIKYRLKIDENAVEGENALSVRFKAYNVDVWEQPEEFNISISTFDATLAVESITIENGMIDPGKTTDLNVTLHNLDDSVLKDIRIKLDLATVPIIPVGSTNEKIVKTMFPGELNTVTFILAADPTAAARLYKVPLQIVFKDELGKNYSKDNTIGVPIGSAPELSVYIESSNLAGGKGEITIKFVNRGLTDVKLLNAKIIESDELTVLTSPEVYIGKVDSDDFESATFSIDLKNKKESFDIPVEIEYLDANNQRYERVVPVPLRMDQNAAKQNGSGMFSTLLFVTPILVILIVFWALMLYSMIKTPMKRYQRYLWIALFIFAHVIGAALFYFIGRKKQQPK